MHNKKILILEGGYNEEHKVSLSTSKEIQKILKKNKIYFKKINVNPKNFEKKISKYKKYIAFNALHGPFGEDGQIQKILKKNKISFTHSSAKSSKVCFDKVAAKKIVMKNKLNTPNYFLLKIEKLHEKELIKINKIFKKFVIKPNSSGSSFGIKIIKTQKEFDKFLKNIDVFKKSLQAHTNILIEEYIPGKELTVSTVKFSNKLMALGVTEIKTNNTFFDYQAKYSDGLSEHILPANLSKKNYKKCLQISKVCHKLLGCNSIARTDFIYNKTKNKIYFLETNTQPGLTSISLLPEQAKYQKISFNDIVLNILENLN